MSVSLANDSTVPEKWDQEQVHHHFAHACNQAANGVHQGTNINNLKRKAEPLVPTDRRSFTLFPASRKTGTRY